MNEHEREELVKSSELDRLVDGELSESEQQALVCRLDNQPDGWRDCALAFLESQCWSKNLRGDSTTLPAASPAEPILQRGNANRSTVGLPANDQEVSAWPTAIGWLATAAALVVAFTLGQRVMPANQLAVGDQGPISPNSEAVALDSLPEARFGLPAATERWLTSSQMPVDVEQVLQRMGADVRQEQGWLLRSDPHGNPLVVPYRDVQIVPANNPL